MNPSPSEPVSYLPLLQTLIGGLLTFLGGLLGSHLIQRSQRKSERKNLASAFYGEISALLSIIEKRGYIQALKNNLKHIEETGEVSFSYFKVTQNYFRVYEQNIGKIGLLNAPLPEKIVTFYTFVFATLEDFEDMAKPEFDTTEVPYVKELLEELVGISNTAVVLGEEIKQLIKPK